MRIVQFFAVGLLILPQSAFAWSDMERIQLATSLGDILASEEFCGLTYNATAISSFIDAKVPNDDMQFTSILDTMTGGAKFNLQEMSDSQKAAHCRQIERVAKAFNFVQ